jgi:hypothetical protein
MRVAQDGGDCDEAGFEPVGDCRVAGCGSRASNGSRKVAGRGRERRGKGAINTERLEKQRGFQNKAEKQRGRSRRGSVIGGLCYLRLHSSAHTALQLHDGHGGAAEIAGSALRQEDPCSVRPPIARHS